MIPWNKGLKGYNTGPRDQKWKDNISSGLKNTYDKRGRKSSANSLMRKSREYLEWRAVVFKRDNYRCQICGKGRCLHPHHIKQLAKYPDKAYDVNNGITLCEACHGVKHGMDFTKTGRRLVCKKCGKKFRSKSGHLKQKYCSQACYLKHRWQFTGKTAKPPTRNKT